jgi:cytochrome c oxidase cbb3-type subunit 4
MSFDVNLVRSTVTVMLFVLFITLCRWAWSDRRRAEFDAAARLPFEDGDEALRNAKESH